MNTTQPVTFYGLGIAPALLQRLNELKFITPTPIQHKAIPVAIQGEDIIGIAQTGTGKTLAFGVPIIQRISAIKKRGLIICPTRELAVQVNETLVKISHNSGVKTAVIIGGDNMHRQTREIRNNPHIIVATPGRLIDHLKNRNVNLGAVGILVLDEADRMLDMGFAPQIKKILAALPAQRQTMLFSATMPAEIVKIANAYMQKPLRVEVAPPGTTVEQVEQEVFVVSAKQKMDLLKHLLNEYHGSILIFSRTKYGAKKIARIIGESGHRTTEIHSNRSPSQRRNALEGFKSGRYRIMIATDIAARGIDINEIELVINYDLPDNSEDYVHRIGRTGRAGAVGKAISFACPEQKHDVLAIERLIRIRLPVKPLPQKIAEAAKNSPSPKHNQNSRDHHRRRRSENKHHSRRHGGKRN